MSYSNKHTYYNVSMYNEEKSPAPARYSVSRNTDIIDYPSDYEIAVIRFKLPLYEMPIFIWRPNVLNLKLSYDSSEVIEPLIYISNGNYSSVYGDSIWSYQEFVIILNNALESAFNALKILEPTMPPSAPLFFIYNAALEKIELMAPTNYLAAMDTKLFVSDVLLNYLMGFQTYTVAGTYNNQILIKNNRNNTETYAGNPYYKMRQEFSTLALWSDFKLITFETTIPVNAENLSGQQSITKTILTDFLPSDGIVDHQAIQYYPKGPIRWYSMNSTIPLRDITMTVKWLDIYDYEHILYISNSEALTVKLAFRECPCLEYGE
jgi:hypothetical protein